MRSIEEIKQELNEIAVQKEELETKERKLYSDLYKAKSIYADNVVESMIGKCFVCEYNYGDYKEKKYKIYYKKTKSGYYHRRTFIFKDDNYCRTEDYKTGESSFVVDDLRGYQEIPMEEFKNIISTGIEEYISKLRRRLTEQFNEVTL